MNLDTRPPTKTSARLRFVCGACDTDLTRLTSLGPLPKSFGLCCEAMVLVPGATSAPRSAH